jgi:hypothetical protein
MIRHRIVCDDNGCHTNTLWQKQCTTLWNKQRKDVEVWVGDDQTLSINSNDRLFKLNHTLSPFSFQANYTTKEQTKASRCRWSFVFSLSFAWTRRHFSQHLQISNIEIFSHSLFVCVWEFELCDTIFAFVLFQSRKTNTFQQTKRCLVCQLLNVVKRV